MPEDPYSVLDLKALRCFWATARHGSLTRAGIELGISESAVSQRVKSLEGYLGTKLYEARGGRVKLTSGGRRALELATALFEQVEAFQREVAGEETSGAVAVATGEPVLRYALPDIVEQFSSRYPKAHLRLFSRHPWECVELTRRNEADVAIIPERELPDDLMFHPWRITRAYLILPRGHPLVRDGRPEIRDLLNEDTVRRYPLIATELDDPHDRRVQAALRREGLPYNVRLHVGNLETVKHYVARGLGLAVVTDMCLTTEDSAAIEVIRIPDDFHGTTTYGIVLRRQKRPTLLLRGLLELLGVAALDAEPPDA